MSAPSNTKDFCTLLLKSKLFSADDLKSVVKQFQSVGKVEDFDAFRRFLLSKKILTDYQLALLSKGISDGFTIGDYKVLEKIGKGRFAGIYRAAHSSGQVVALKVLPQSKAKDAEVLARFQREAKLVTQLNHPNVVKAFQVSTGDGVHFLALEHLEGRTLEEVLNERKKLPPVEAVRIIEQAMRGLQHLYEKKVIHRDIKPSNIMLVPPAGESAGKDTLRDTVKILDIGLGKNVFDENAKSAVDDPSLTEDGTLLGTPDYMAPEQARDASKADIRADIYSLGCVLYECLTGQTPFPDKSVLNQVLRHATETPKPLSEFISSVPDGLQQVMNFLMAKDPNQRYATPEKALQGLAIFLRNVPEVKPTPAANPAYSRWLEGQDDGTSRKPAMGKLDSNRVEKPASIDFDVELVALPPGGVIAHPPAATSEETEPRTFFEFDRRDYTMMAVGALMISVALAAGYGLSQALKRSPKPVKTEEELKTPVPQTPIVPQNPTVGTPTGSGSMTPEPKNESMPKE